ncbi:uncharacterized protein [Diadema antillarum]|uniref:uncharacterized protein n=1 Tax=Diadema antillarum TaxID=105358 RepID=UPI003A87E5C3
MPYRLILAYLLARLALSPTEAADNVHEFAPSSLVDTTTSVHITSDDVVDTVGNFESIGTWLWVVNTTLPGHRVQMDFSSFQLVVYSSILEIGDGKHNDEINYGWPYTRLARFSGDSPDGSVTSISNSLWIEFICKTNQVRDIQFVIDVHSVGPTDDQTETSIVLQNHSPITITSPHYPNAYRINSFRRWQLQAPANYGIALKFSSFNLQASDGNCLDYVYVGDTGTGIIDQFLNRAIGMVGSGGRVWQYWVCKMNNDIFDLFNYRSTTSHIHLLFISSFKSGGTGFSVEVTVFPFANGDVSTAKIATTNPTTATTGVTTGTTNMQTTGQSSSRGTTEDLRLVEAGETDGNSDGRCPSPDVQMDQSLCQPCEEGEQKELLKICVIATSALLGLSLLVTIATCIHYQRNRRISVVRKAKRFNRTSSKTPVLEEGSARLHPDKIDVDDYLVPSISPYGPIVFSRTDSAGFHSSMYENMREEGARHPYAQGPGQTPKRTTVESRVNPVLQSSPVGGRGLSHVYYLASNK